jgi:hypothetical protein
MRESDRGFPVFLVRKMSADGASRPSSWMFNVGGTIAGVTGGFSVRTGVAVRDFPVQVLCDSGDTIEVGDDIGPEENEWHVSKDGSGLSVFCDDVIATVDSVTLKTCWVVEGAGLGTKVIEYTITSLVNSDEPDFNLLKKATVVVRGGPAGLVGTDVSVYDHSGCIFDEEDMEGYTGWASWSQYRTLDTNEDCEVLTPFHWAAFNRCCAPNSGTYRGCP